MRPKVESFVKSFGADLRQMVILSARQAGFVFQSFVRGVVKKGH